MNQKPRPSSNITPQQSAELESKVPDYLRVSPELAEEIETEQKKLRAKFAQRFSKPTHEETALHLAINYEQAARRFFEAVAKGAPATEKELSFNRRRLAQSLQAQGRYEEAVEVLDKTVSAEETLAVELIQEFHALIVPDGEFCSCASPTGFPTSHITKTVRKPTGEVVPLIRCTVCGHVNATTQTPEDLGQLEKMRFGKAKVSDSELLKRQ